MNRKQLISQMYWKERAIAVSNQAHKRADKMEEGMLKALRLAESRIKRDIQSWYSKFAFDNEISMSEARKLLTEAELAEFKWTVDEYIEFAKQYAGFGDPDWERRLANASARVHIQRLEALQLQIRAEIERAANEQQMIMSNGIPLIYEESFNKTLEALGETAAMSRVNTKAIEKIAEKPWTTDGKTFSGRIWENKEKLVNSLQTDLIQAVTRGDTHAEMTNRLAERMNTSRYNAGRLVRTETTYINARATQDAYKENNVEKVEIIGTLDSRVCALCSDMDGITIDMKTYEPGVTVPPFHPMCRCTTAPAVEDIPDDIFEQLDAMIDSDFDSQNMAGENGDYILDWPPKGNAISKKDFKELREYAKGKGVAINGLKKADVDVDLMREMVDETARMLETYPHLKTDEKGNMFALQLSSTMREEDFAYTNPGVNHILYLNENAFRRKDKLEKNYNYLEDKNWFVKGTDYKSVIYHEFGHLISDKYSIDGLSIAKEILKNDVVIDVLEYCVTELSEYSAKEDGSEIISEVFSKYYSKAEKSDFALAFMSACDRIILERTDGA